MEPLTDRDKLDAVLALIANERMKASQKAAYMGEKFTDARTHTERSRMAGTRDYWNTIFALYGELYYQVKEIINETGNG